MDSNSRLNSATDGNVPTPTNIETRHEYESTFDDGESTNNSIECNLDHEQATGQNQITATNMESQPEIEANPDVESNEPRHDMINSPQEEPKAQKIPDTWEEEVASWSNIMPPICPWQDTDKCSICLEAYTETSHPAQVNPCQHIFHYECIEEWMKEWQQARGQNTRTKFECPSCRTEIKDFKSNFTANGECYLQSNMGRVQNDVPIIFDSILVTYPRGLNTEEVILYWIHWLEERTHMRVVVLRGLQGGVHDLEIHNPFYDVEEAIHRGTRLP